MQSRAIITVVGPDRVGIIAEVCSLLAELRISVDEISQTIMADTFTMIMRVHTTDGAPDFGTIQNRMVQKGEDMGLSIRIQREAIFSAMHTI
ncbi:MAG: ACT domain-containing protein [Oscillospiraceae bacterium]|nr:ACT domain-containing protein [Oscillospiraceae bacterium]